MKVHPADGVSGRRVGGASRGWAAAAALAVLTSAGPAHGQFVTSQAQKEKEKAALVRPTPPRAKKADDPPTIWMTAIAGILLLGIATAALIPSKRGHQD